MALKHMGADWYANAVDRQLRLTRRFAEKIESIPGWNIAVAPATAIVTFRYEPERIALAISKKDAETERALQQRNALQEWIAGTVQEEGRFWISATPVPEGTALRLNVISYLTDESTIDALLDTLPELGNRAEGMIF